VVAAGTALQGILNPKEVPFMKSSPIDCSFGHWDVPPLKKKKNTLW
jgi:hypothetical protein